MFYAWVLYAGYYAATTACTLLVLVQAAGTEHLAAACGVFAGIQVVRVLPSWGIVGLPGDLVRWLNYHVMLTGYRLNYL